MYPNFHSITYPFFVSPNGTKDVSFSLYSERITIGSSISRLPTKSIPVATDSPTFNCLNPYFHLADSIARIFSPYYPICYSLHYDTDYLHCHYILSTTSGLPNVPSLSSNEFHGFFLKIQELVQSQGFELIINDEGGYLNV